MGDIDITCLENCLQDKGCVHSVDVGTLGCRHVSHYYGHGDWCEEAGQPRQVEVKLKLVQRLGSLGLEVLTPNCVVVVVYIK